MVDIETIKEKNLDYLNKLNTILFKKEDTTYFHNEKMSPRKKKTFIIL